VRLYSLVRLQAFQQDLLGVGKYSELGTLVRMALHAPPDERGVIEYEIEPYE
jgi:hypothetical protein